MRRALRFEQRVLHGLPARAPRRVAVTVNALMARRWALSLMCVIVHGDGAASTMRWRRQGLWVPMEGEVTRPEDDESTPARRNTRNASAEVAVP